MNRNTILMILDGWGIGNGMKSDVIFSTPTPNIDKLKQEYPNSYLYASGENVGLPDGQMGNSEVGHMNIGAGRIAVQILDKINKEVENKNFFNNALLHNAFNYAVKNNKKVHLLGLVSDGGVHSVLKHLFALIDLSEQFDCKNTFIHALTDGRDTDPKSGINFIKQLVDKIAPTSVKLASLAGRFYTMDRDNRWDRIKVGYDLLVSGIGEKSTDILESIKKSYETFEIETDKDGNSTKKYFTDEFIKPIVMVNANNMPIATIDEGDVVISFNFRTDRPRQITSALTQKDFPEYGMRTIPLQYYTMTRYDESFTNINVIYEKETVPNTLGEIISKNNLNQLRIAETEKYAHVTFFFNGGVETPYQNEDRILIKSPKVLTYDLQPEMSALEVKNNLTAAIDTQKYNLIVVNFANGDMIGHTGIYSAIEKAVETVDACVGEVVDIAMKNSYNVVIIADHGNADYALNPDNSPNTAHSLNPVPIIVVSKDYTKVKSGILADVAPTILNLMGLEIPKEMTGQVLIS